MVCLILHLFSTCTEVFVGCWSACLTLLSAYLVAADSSPYVDVAGAGVRTAGGNSSLVSPESSVGGLSGHRYQWQSHPVAEPSLVAAQSTPAYESDPLERLSDHEEPRVRHQLPDLDSSQPGPIEIDTSLLYTPQSGNSSTDVSHSGGTWHVSAPTMSQLVNLCCCLIMPFDPALPLNSAEQAALPNLVCPDLGQAARMTAWPQERFFSFLMVLLWR